MLRPKSRFPLDVWHSSLISSTPEAAVELQAPAVCCGACICMPSLNQTLLSWIVDERWRVSETCHPRQDRPLRQIYISYLLPIIPTTTWLLKYCTCCRAVKEAGSASTLCHAAVEPCMKIKIHTYIHFVCVCQTFMVYLSKSSSKYWEEWNPCRSVMPAYEKRLFFPLPCSRRQIGWRLTCLLETNALAQKQTNWRKWLQKGLNEIQIRLKRERCFRSTQIWLDSDLTRQMHLDNKKKKQDVAHQAANDLEQS